MKSSAVPFVTPRRRRMTPYPRINDADHEQPFVLSCLVHCIACQQPNKYLHEPAVKVRNVASLAEYEWTTVAHGYIYVWVTDDANVSNFPIIHASTSEMFRRKRGGMSG